MNVSCMASKNVGISNKAKYAGDSEVTKLILRQCFPPGRRLTRLPELASGNKKRSEKQNAGSARRVTHQAGAPLSPSTGQRFSTLTLSLTQPGQLETIRTCAKAVVSFWLG